MLCCFAPCSEWLRGYARIVTITTIRGGADREEAQVKVDELRCRRDYDRYPRLSFPYAGTCRRSRRTMTSWYEYYTLGRRRCEACTLSGRDGMGVRGGELVLEIGGGLDPALMGAEGGCSPALGGVLRYGCFSRLVYEARRGGRRNVIGERAVGIWSFVLFVGGICLLHEYEYLTGCCDESRLAKQIVLL